MLWLRTIDTPSNLVAAIAERLSPANRPAGFAALLVTLLRELVKGRPVPKEALAKALVWTVERVAAVLDEVPNTEYDEQGRVLGYAVTLRETQHTFEVGGQRLYTWCAFDTLMFPAVIGKTARVASRCPQTGEPIVLTVAPDEVSNLEPPGAVLSLLMPDASADIRSSFCCHVHFFASASAGNIWSARHPGSAIVSVGEAFLLANTIARRLLECPALPS